MLCLTSRSLLSIYGSRASLFRRLNKLAVSSDGKFKNEQLVYIKSVIEKNTNDWSTVKRNILDKRGNLNQKNIDGVLLKLMISNKKFDTAQSFADYLKNCSDQLNLGTINGILGLYCEIGKENNLLEKDKMFILNNYESLYDKYKVLDSCTCEKLLHALCVINEWKKALKVLDDIHMSSNPSHSAYSTLIATLFKNNRKNEAMALIEKSISNKRPLQYVAYEGWINYILNKYKDKKTIIKYLDEICSHISRNYEIISLTFAEKIKQTYLSFGWNAQFTKIRKRDGQCDCCKDTLDCLKLTEEEFQLLQYSVKQKLIIGSDLFLKTSPHEFTRFINFVEETAPYDIVLDALNIAYAVRKGIDRLGLLKFVVDYFKQQNKKILLIGRKHMFQWQKQTMQYLINNTHFFFTDDLSQDDPYFITAAILSGSHTDIVSKDLLRGHRFLLKDEQLCFIFRRWQWQHQWMVYCKGNKSPHIQSPLKFSACAHKKNDGWHIPFERPDVSTTRLFNDGVPDLSSWLCLKPKLVR